MIFGFVTIKGDSVFQYNETLIEFPFNSKTEHRSKSGDTFGLWTQIWSNSNKFTYMVPNNTKVPNGTICNFLFII